MSARSFMKLEIPSRSENEAFARVVVAAFASRLDPTLDEVSDIKTAVSEAVTNAIIHAYEDKVGLITITARLENWKLERLPAVDRAILRLATWELLHATDVDIDVVLDEAVILAKELSTDESPSFVNGVLGKIAILAPQVRAAGAAE